jgi:hypothetical protein
VARVRFRKDGSGSGVQIPTHPRSGQMISSISWPDNPVPGRQGNRRRDLRDLVQLSDGQQVTRQPSTFGNLLTFYPLRLSGRGDPLQSAPVPAVWAAY